MTAQKWSNDSCATSPGPPRSAAPQNRRRARARAALSVAEPERARGIGIRRSIRPRSSRRARPPCPTDWPRPPPRRRRRRARRAGGRGTSPAAARPGRAQHVAPAADDAVDAAVGEVDRLRIQHLVVDIVESELAAALLGGGHHLRRHVGRDQPALAAEAGRDVKPVSPRPGGELEDRLARLWVERPDEPFGDVARDIPHVRPLTAPPGRDRAPLGGRTARASRAASESPPIMRPCQRTAG